jgi:hypothetical protein
LDSGIESSLESFNDDTGSSRVEEHFAVGLADKGSNDQDLHGTHVSGIAAGNGRYSDDGSWALYDAPGIAPQASIISVRVLDSDGFGNISDIVDGIQIAIEQDADIISMSLSSELYDGLEDIHQVVINEAIKAGITVIAAAGNLGPYGSGVGIPGGLENVIAVGAIDMTDLTMWENSGVGPRVNGYPGPNVVAPGVDVVSVNKNGEPHILSGTSMAAPHVTGGIALLKEAFPSATPYHIQEAITASALDMGLFAPIEAQGRGLVNIYGAYEILNSTVLSNDSLEMSSAPNIIKDQNYYYRNRISGLTKQFPFYIHSSRNVTIIPHTDLERTHGVSFELPSTMNIVTGLNRFIMNLTVETDIIDLNEGRIYFTEEDTDRILNNANISYISITSFSQSKIIFDTSHDLDTPTAYFGGHGPQGQMSKFASLLEDEGHIIYEHTEGEINESVLENFDLLVIVDPDTDYLSSEVDAIQKFTQDDGNSLFLVVGGGLLLAENYTYAPFNKDSINDILSGSGILISTEEDTISSCTTKNNEDRRILCHNTAEMTHNQEIFTNVDEFPNYGPKLDTEEGINFESEVIAKQNGKPVIVSSSSTSSTGRILVFSSPLLFDNKGLMYNYGSSGSARDNREILEQGIDWLIEQRAIQVEYSINNKEADNSITMSMYDGFTLSLVARTPEGDIIPMGPHINLSAIEVSFNGGYLFYYITIPETGSPGSGIYQVSLLFDRHATIDFYIHVSDPTNSSIQSNGHFTLRIRLDDFDNQASLQSIAKYLFMALVISWILWIMNEGGRLRKLKLKSKEV